MKQGNATFKFDQREERFTHNCFRYPAKFHPPIAAQLIKDYAKDGAVVLDPFCGSGTVNLEADLAGLRSFGIDCDPLAIFVAQCKTEVQSLDQLEKWINKFCRSSIVVNRARSVHVHAKISPRELKKRQLELSYALPDIPNIDHWYHPAVAIELGILRDEIFRSAAPKQVKSVLWLTFASMVRAVSYADPVPVSGLEVTHHMRKRIEIGYEISVGALFLKKLKKNFTAFTELTHFAHRKQSVFKLKDSTSGRMLGRHVDLLVTSPPYQNAVDYYRRHALEMYWLGFVRTRADRLGLIDKYVGRSRVAKKSAMLQEVLPNSKKLLSWVREVEAADAHRALDMKHYFTAMGKVFERTASVLESKGQAVFVVGDSQWNGETIPTHEILMDIAAPHLEFKAISSYSLKNRHMSYARRNGADIDREFVLVFAKGGKK